MDITLETPRLTLRPWAPADIPDLTLCLDDLALTKWLAFVPHPYRRSDAENWIRHCRTLASEARPTAYEFAIERKADRRLIGGVSLNKIDRQAGTGGGGIWLAAADHGQGYGREAFEAKIRFAFTDLGLLQLNNGYFAGNDASWSMQRALGYRPAGEKPSRCLADGRPTIEHLTMLLRSDWEARTK